MFSVFCSGESKVNFKKNQDAVENRVSEAVRGWFCGYMSLHGSPEAIESNRGHLYVPIVSTSMIMKVYESAHVKGYEVTEQEQ